MFLVPKKPRWRMISATCGGTIWSQLSSPLAMRLSTSREKIGRYFGIEVIELHEAAAADQIIIERLQIGFHLERVDGL